VIAWQERRNYPLTLFTEASIDLADDPELIELMVRANFVATFIGIESPDEESLREAKKFQNVRAGGTLLEKVRRIQAAGMEVWCGMIMGFDHDDQGIFDRQIQFVQEARIAFSMSGMLSAIPKTPLYDRLAAAGRLDNAAADDPRIATNVIPLGMSREALRDGWLDLMDRLYDVDNYMQRFEALFIEGRLSLATAKMTWLRRHRPLSYLKIQALTILAALVMLARLWSDPRTRPYRPAYARTLRRLLLSGRPPRYLFQFAFKCIMHTHFAIMTRRMVRGESRLVNT
jgi:hypothetical protein